MANCQKCEQQVICPWAIPEEIICSSFKSKPVTNADRIRSLSDDELAAFLQGVAIQGGIELGGRLTTWLDWLKQEAKNEQTTDLRV